jgi:N-acetylneuraminic acid mutarotase
VIEASVYETTVKPMPLRKRLQLVCLIMVAILTLCFTMPLPFVAAPGTNSFTGSASVTDWVKFTLTGSMNTGRQVHTATLLNNGKVLVAGRYGESSASAELYDPIAGIWTPTGSMNVARSRHTATLLNNGKVLVAGGPGLASAELYDSDTGTWSTTGSMSVARYRHTATLLNDGKVLAVGGDGGTFLASAELYDPDTGTWSTTGSMSVARYNQAATLLNDGKVLVAGGFNGDHLSSAELYDPDTGTWSNTSSMNVGRGGNPTATLLDNGKVLVAGGTYRSSPASAELYDPATGAWSSTGIGCCSLSTHTATLLNNGQVLVAGGEGGYTSAKLYDPSSGTWSSTGSLNGGRSVHTATLLNNGKVLLAGGQANDGSYLASAELGTLIPGNTFTGTLTLPSGWLSSTTISAEFVGATSAAVINAGTLSNDNTTWGDWIAATSDVIATTTWTVSGEGANKPIYLRLRDINDQVATVVTGTVNVDLTAPTSSMTPLPSFVGSTTVPLSWSGSDALSGVSTYDVQYYRAGSALFWIDWLTNVTTTSASFTGQDGQTYGFRVRARDNVGNVSTYSPGDTQTTVDVTPPAPGDLIINGGALSATAINVTLSLSATDATSGVAMASFSNDGSAWSAWQSYATQASWSLLSGDGIKTVYARFRDVAGNVSSSVSNTIVLDTATGAEYGVTINDGALFTNQTTVALTISARPGTAQMQVSNDGGFAGAHWEPYASRKAWAITQYGSYVIPRVVYVRYKDLGGNVSSNYQDDIILDVTPPVGIVSIIGAAGLQAMASTVTLELSATDDVSGVGQMLISNQPDFAGAIWESYATSRAWALGSNMVVYVRFRDNAGNVSVTYSASRPSNWSVFLPLILK